MIQDHDTINGTLKMPTVRLVFDRYKVASKTKKGLVQIEVLFRGRRKWMSTGVKVFQDQWNSRWHVQKAPDSDVLNASLNKQVVSLEQWVRDNLPFSWDKLAVHMKEGKPDDNFINYLEKAIKTRGDIRESTRRAHLKIIGILEEFGKIKSISDLTRAKIMDFDNWLHWRKIRKLDKEGQEVWVNMRQQSIYGYHKLLRTYIHYGIRSGTLKNDPYLNTRFQRGESEPGRYISKQELQRMMQSEMRSGSIARARDMFVFQSYTGLSYADLKLFDFSKVIVDNKDYLYSGLRKKTGESFYFVILKPALDILKKYNYELPVTSSQTYDRNLKKVASDCGIEKPLSSHWARRTAGMMLINAGVRLEVVAKILGHSSVKTTEQFYASITEQTVKEEMKRAKL